MSMKLAPKSSKLAQLREHYTKNVEIKPEIVSQDQKPQSNDTSLTSNLFGSVSDSRDNILKASLNEEQKQTVQNKVASHAKQFQEKQRLRREPLKRKITSIFHYLTDKDLDLALDLCLDREEQVILNLSSSPLTYLEEIRLKHAQDKTPEASNQKDKTTCSKKAFKTMVKQKHFKNVGRVEMSQAIEKLEQNETEGLSEARILAFKAIKDNPNKYYYRFNEPGEEARNGPWTKEEHQLFLKRYKEVGADGQWGLFAKVIPGRVGYQCSNYFRKLLAKGELTDPNYFFDKDGKLHYKFSTKEVEQESEAKEQTENTKKVKKSKKSKKSDDSEEAEQEVLPKKTRKSIKQEQAEESEEQEKPTKVKAAPTPKRQQRKKKQEIVEDEDLELEDDEDEDKEQEELKCNVFLGSSSSVPAHDPNSDFDYMAIENPLPGFIDPIDLTQVVKPALSPYGHVMSYHNWIRILCHEQKNTCPFTRKPLRKRDLILLTMDNIEKYRSMIVK